MQNDRNDVISRQAAIEYLMTNMNWHDEDGYEVDDVEKRSAITDLINGVPSAQSTQSNVPNMLDVISRRVAIDALKEHRALYCDNTPNSFSKLSYAEKSRVDELDTAIATLVNLPSAQPHWIPCSERLPSKEERKEWIDNNLDGIGYLYPCLVTRYSSINSDWAKNNPYVAKHYFDGEDFLNAGEEVCSEYIIAWMPLPDPFEKD